MTQKYTEKIISYRFFRSIKEFLKGIFERNFLKEMKYNITRIGANKGSGYQEKETIEDKKKKEKLTTKK